MSRLTTKTKLGDYIFIDGEQTCLNTIATKLGKLEDLEDELGCPLDVVFKALKDGIVYIENDRYTTDRCIALHFLAYEKEWVLIYDIDFMYSYLLKDYKKTWWLKEDLSKWMI